MIVREIDEQILCLPRVPAHDAMPHNRLEVEMQPQVEFDAEVHERQVTFSRCWIVKNGRGLDLYQKAENFYAFDLLFVDHGRSIAESCGNMRQIAVVLWSFNGLSFQAPISEEKYLKWT